MALSIFAFASTSAARQSLNPAPVLSRKDPKSVVSSDLLLFLRSRSLTLLPQNLDGLIDICVRFHKRRAAIAESRPGPLAQLLHKMCWNLHGWLLCAHPFFSSLI